MVEIVRLPQKDVSLTSRGSFSGLQSAPTACWVLRSCTMTLIQCADAPVVSDAKRRGLRDKELARVIQPGKYLFRDSKPSLPNSREDESEAWARGGLSSASFGPCGLSGGGCGG